MADYSVPSLCYEPPLTPEQKERLLLEEYQHEKMFISEDELDTLCDDLSPFFNMNGQRLFEMVTSKFSNEFRVNKFWSRAGIKYKLQQMTLTQLDNRIDIGDME